jgi:ABC-type multidrug transport system fused ATPase/permease subunit
MSLDNMSLYQRLDNFVKKYVYKGGLNGISFVIVFVLLLVFGCYVMLPVEIVKALLDVSAMFLGLFGVFVVYLLSYYDSRIDKLEKEIEYEKNTRNLNVWGESDEQKVKRATKINAVEKKLAKIKDKKGSTANMSLFTFVCFMVSLVSSIVTLGLLSTNSQGWLLDVIRGSASVTLASLFVGILLVFTLIRRIGKEI